MYLTLPQYMTIIHTMNGRGHIIITGIHKIIQ